MTKKNIFWKAISVVFHPLVMPLYFILFYYLYTLDIILPGEIMFVSVSLGISTLVIPILMIWVLKTMGRVESMSLKDPQERRLPILAVCILLGWAIYRMLPVASTELMMPIIGMEIALAALYISLYWTKISIHAMASAAMMTAVFMLLYRWQDNYEVALIPLAVCVVVYDLVVMARMELGSHSARQVAGGTAVGVLGQCISFFIWG